MGGENIMKSFWFGSIAAVIIAVVIDGAAPAVADQFLRACSVSSLAKDAISLSTMRAAFVSIFR